MFGGYYIASYHEITFTKSVGMFFPRRERFSGIAIGLKRELSDGDIIRYEVLTDNGKGIISCNKDCNVISVSELPETDFLSRLSTRNLELKEFTFNTIPLVCLSIIDVEKVKIVFGGKRGGSTTYRDFMDNFQLMDGEYFKVSYDNGYSYCSERVARFDYKKALPERLAKDFAFRHRCGDIEIWEDEDCFFHIQVWLGNDSEYSEISNS